MFPIVYRIYALLGQILREVPVATNLGLFPLIFVLLSGRFLNARGAVFPALADLGLSPQAVRRAQAALCYARFSTKRLFAAWRALVLEEGHFRSHVYEGVRPLPRKRKGNLIPATAPEQTAHWKVEKHRKLKYRFK